MLTYLEAFAIAMAALVNAVLAYEERANHWKAAVLWTIRRIPRGVVRPYGMALLLTVLRP